MPQQITLPLPNYSKGIYVYGLKITRYMLAGLDEQTDSLHTSALTQQNNNIFPDVKYFSEPPTSVTIMDFSGQELGEARAGPYSLDSILSLTCVSSGGN